LRTDQGIIFKLVQYHVFLNVAYVVAFFNWLHYFVIASWVTKATRYLTRNRITWFCSDVRVLTVPIELFLQQVLVNRVKVSDLLLVTYFMQLEVRHKLCCVKSYLLYSSNLACWKSTHRQH